MSPDSLSRVPSSTQRILEGVSADLHGGMAWLQGACELLGRGHSFVYRCVLLGNKTVHVSWALESQPSSRLPLGPVTARGGRGPLSSSPPSVDTDHGTRLPASREPWRGLHLASRALQTLPPTHVGVCPCSLHCPEGQAPFPECPWMERGLGILSLCPAGCALWEVRVVAQAPACAAWEAPVDPAYRPGSLGLFLTIVWRGPAGPGGVEVSLPLTTSLFLPRFCCLLTNTFQRTASCPPIQPRLGAVEPFVPVPLGSRPRPRAPTAPGQACRVQPGASPGPSRHRRRPLPGTGV